AVGVPSAVAGQNVAAGVVALPGVVPSPQALKEAVASALGAHAVPRPLRVLDALPRNANGKVDRPALAELLRPAGPGPAPRS
ncbi:MAG: O-succinylbenzoate--CoA ligase, partial [Frankiales bacterium]|nr:O-succinylbenzoate--CoA ligase [Frankiales bacterium]